MIHTRTQSSLSNMPEEQTARGRVLYDYSQDLPKVQNLVLFYFLLELTTQPTYMLFSFLISEMKKLL